MSFSTARKYFKDILTAQGFDEHNDAFDDQNVPQTGLAKTYQLVDGNISGGPANQRIHNFTYPIAVKLFFNQYNKNTSEVIDEAIDEIEVLMNEFLKSRHGLVIKDVIPDGISPPRPLSVSNDVVVVYELNFSVSLSCLFS